MRLRLHSRCLVAGDPARRPLVLLHGFTGDTTTWAGLVAELNADRPVWALDLPGHGRSPAPEDPGCYTMPAVVASVAEVVAGRGIERAHWLGYSMGGRVALSLAVDRPEVVASLCLVGASPGIVDPAARAARRAEDEALAERLEREGMEAFVAHWMAQALFATQARLGQDHLARMRAQRLANDPHALARVLRGLGTGAMAPLVDRLAQIRTPVLLVTGGLDEKFTRLAHDMASRLPKAEVVTVPEVGHAVQIEAPQALAAALRAFLQRVEAG